MWRACEAHPMRALLVVVIALSACGAVVPANDSGVADDAGMAEDAGAIVDAGLAEDAGSSDAGTVDGGLDAGVRKQAACASTFGSVLTNAFGRIDGTVIAVVPPGDPGCALPNSDHVVVQVSFDGGVHRMVINVESSFGDPRIRLREVTAPLPSPAFAPGWHPGLALDYPTQLGVHSDGGWEALPLQQAAQRVYDLVEVGAPIAVYATSSGGSFAASAHKVHRNGSNTDGALVLNPTSAAPTWVLFHFANQSF